MALFGLKYIKIHETYQVYTEQNVYLGEMYKEVDGYYVYWPYKERNGFWSAEGMMEIANKLIELNKEWDEQIKNDPNI